MKKILLLSLLSIFLLVHTACDKPPFDDEVIIKTGTSFGFCWGYCVTETEITSEQMAFERRTQIEANIKEFPTIRCEETTDSSTWNSLLAALNKDSISFFALPDVIGCPDCADGGAEWISITNGVLSKTVTFEHGDNIKEISNLLKQIRNTQRQFEKCE